MRCRPGARACFHSQSCHHGCAKVSVRGLRQQVFCSTGYAAEDHTHVCPGKIQARAKQHNQRHDILTHFNLFAVVFRNVHTALLGPVVSLISLLPEGSMPVYATVCRGVTELAEGIFDSSLLCTGCACLSASSRFPYIFISLQMHMEL